MQHALGIPMTSTEAARSRARPDSHIRCPQAAVEPLHAPYELPAIETNREEEENWVTAFAAGLISRKTGDERINLALEKFIFISRYTFEDRCQPPTIANAAQLLCSWGEEKIGSSWDSAIGSEEDVLASIQYMLARAYSVNATTVLQDAARDLRKVLQDPEPLISSNLAAHLELLQPAAQLASPTRSQDNTSSSSSSLSSFPAAQEPSAVPRSAHSISTVSKERFEQFQFTALRLVLDEDLPYEERAILTNEELEVGGKTCAYFWPKRPGSSTRHTTANSGGSNTHRSRVNSLHFMLRHYWLIMTGAVLPSFCINSLSNQVFMLAHHHSALDNHNLAILPSLEFLEYTLAYLESMAKTDVFFDYEIFVDTLPSHLTLTKLKYSAVALDKKAPAIIVTPPPPTSPFERRLAETVYRPKRPEQPEQPEQPLSGLYASTDWTETPMPPSTFERNTQDLDHLLNPLLVTLEAALKAILHLKGVFPPAYAPHFRLAMLIFTNLFAYARHEEEIWNDALGVVSYLRTTKKDQEGSKKRTWVRVANEWEEAQKVVRGEFAPAAQGDGQGEPDAVSERAGEREGQNKRTKR